MISSAARHQGIGAGRLRAALLAGVVVWAVVVVRLAMIQLVHAPGLVEYAEKQHIVRVKLSADRGNIFDCNMVPLTDNLTVQSVCAYPKEINSAGPLARQLARTLGGSYDEYLDKLTRDRNFVWIKRQLPPEKAAELKSLGLPGIGFLPESRRVHLLGPTASQVIGMTDIDGCGLSGIELSMDDLLTGAEATVYRCLDSAQRRTATPACTRIVPKDGASVVLTIDSHLQSIAEVELERAVRQHEAAGGTVIIQDPWTGEILAMANWPTFDPDRPGLYSVESRKNRAITDQFEPGSTFKLITAAAALSTGSADLGSVYHACRGAKSYGRFTIHDVHEYGWLDFEHAFAKSSNVCFADIATSVGAHPLYAFARDFGFGCMTGIPLPGEVRGLLREPSEWSGRSVPTVGIGQEVGVTALQLVGAYSAVANGGYLMQPQIIKAILSDDGRVIEEARWTVVRQVIDNRVAATLRELMTCVTEYGTGKNARVAEIPVAGKTGTAQKAGQGGRYDPSKWVSSFVGMAPADDPQIVCLVVIDEPRGRGLGGEVAAPVFAKIVERMVRSAGHEYLLRGRSDYVADERPKGRAERMTEAGIQPSLPSRGRAWFQASNAAAGGEREGSVVSAALSHNQGEPVVNASFSGEQGQLVPDAASGVDPDESVAVIAGTCAVAEPKRGGVLGAFRSFRASRGADAASLLMQSERGAEKVAVPDFRGMSVRRARQVAAESNLVLSFEGSGRVREQSPRPGSTVSPGHKVVVRCYR
ncbi:MAG: PASTA domain-containing protein [Candidatus Eisenbacteria bacterium]|nr:PASTA domain-containing protein [Candidatus Eisenbacteria bacterium]